MVLAVEVGLSDIKWSFIQYSNNNRDFITTFATIFMIEIFIEVNIWDVLTQHCNNCIACCNIFDKFVADICVILSNILLFSEMVSPVTKYHINLCILIMYLYLKPICLLLTYLLTQKLYIHIYYTIL